MGTSFWDTATSFTVTAWRSCTDFLFQYCNLFLNKLSYLVLGYKALNKKQLSSPPPRRQTTPNCLNWIKSCSETSKGFPSTPEYRFWVYRFQVHSSWVWRLILYQFSKSPCLSHLLSLFSVHSLLFSLSWLWFILFPISWLCFPLIMTFKILPIFQRLNSSTTCLMLTETEISFILSFM